MAETVEQWKPALSPTIEGEVVSLGTGSSEYGEFPLVTIRTTSGDYSVAGFHAVLRRQLDEASLDAGDNIRIEYKGKGVSKKGREFHNYELVRLT